MEIDKGFFLNTSSKDNKKNMFQLVNIDNCTEGKYMVCLSKIYQRV